MKRLSLAVSALVLVAGSATAADLPRRSAPPVFAPAPIFTWTGFYVGAHAGVDFNKARGSVIVGGTPYTASISSDGLVGGLHAGYNWQTGAIVLGLEGDVDYNSAKGSAPMLSAAGVALGVTGSEKNRWQGSLRARVGYAIDKFLVYGTGGVALTSADFTGVLGATTETHSSSRVGWTLGAGVEYAFTNAISARLEYRYTDFGKKSLTYTTFPGAPYVAGTRLREQAVLAGISYKF